LSFTPVSKLLFCGSIFFQHQEISQVTSRTNQTYSATTGVTGYGP